VKNVILLLYKKKEDFIPLGEVFIMRDLMRSIQANEHLKTTAATDPLREAFLKLIDVTIGKLPTVNYETIQDLLKKISDTFDSFSVTNMKLELGIKKLTEEDVKKIVKDEVSKKILDSVVKDTYSKELDIKIEDVGQGTQRLIIAAILQELSKTDTQVEELFLIFEEPEIYLHPKLKKSLYNALFKISKENNVNVILTTHDPYFIELGVGQKIYNVFRDKDGSTDVKPPLTHVLSSSTTAEINYIIFEVPSTDYLLQLAQKAEESGNKDFKDHKIEGISIFDIRGTLAHKTDSTGRDCKKQPDITESMKKGAIDYLRSTFEEETEKVSETGNTPV
jgi:hypothetical protein